MIPFEMFCEVEAVRQKCSDLRRDGLRIGLVPTMGFLHEGHLALLRAGRARCDVLVLSIFVNPTQFAPGEDFDQYPKDQAGDLRKARNCGVNIVFCPTAESMYRNAHQTLVTIPKLSNPLCGAYRPNHFAAVATIVTKLFHIVTPHIAIFGEKDYQQLAIIRQLVADLDFPTKIFAVATVREPDGLAMSSRNSYLDPMERQQATALFKALKQAEKEFNAGETNVENLIATVHRVVAQTPLVRIEYVELRDAKTLAPVDNIATPSVLAIAAYVGSTRLIDNVVLES